MKFALKVPVHISVKNFMLANFNEIFTSL